MVLVVLWNLGGAESGGPGEICTDHQQIINHNLHHRYHHHHSSFISGLRYHGEYRVCFHGEYLVCVSMVNIWCVLPWWISGGVAMENIWCVTMSNVCCVLPLWTSGVRYRGDRLVCVVTMVTGWYALPWWRCPGHVWAPAYSSSSASACSSQASPSPWQPVAGSMLTTEHLQARPL